MYVIDIYYKYSVLWINSMPATVCIYLPALSNSVLHLQG